MAPADPKVVSLRSRLKPNLRRSQVGEGREGIALTPRGLMGRAQGLQERAAERRKDRSSARFAIKSLSTTPAGTFTSVSTPGRNPYNVKFVLKSLATLLTLSVT